MRPLSELPVALTIHTAWWGSAGTGFYVCLCWEPLQPVTGCMCGLIERPLGLLIRSVWQFVGCVVQDQAAVMPVGVAQEVLGALMLLWQQCPLHPAHCVSLCPCLSSQSQGVSGARLLHSCELVVCDGRIALLEVSTALPITIKLFQRNTPWVLSVQFGGVVLLRHGRSPNVFPASSIHVAFFVRQNSMLHESVVLIPPVAASSCRPNSFIPVSLVSLLDPSGPLLSSAPLLDRPGPGQPPQSQGTNRATHVGCGGCIWCAAAFLACL